MCGANAIFKTRLDGPTLQYTLEAQCAAGGAASLFQKLAGTKACADEASAQHTARPTLFKRWLVRRHAAINMPTEPLLSIQPHQAVEYAFVECAATRLCPSGTAEPLTHSSL